MNLQQAKITLEKINRLYQSITLDNSVDKHEQQLMLIYIRQLYKAFSDEAIVETHITNRKTTQQKPSPQATKPVVTPAPPVEKVVKVAPQPTPIVEIVKKEEPVIIEETPVETPETTPIVTIKEEPKRVLVEEKKIVRPAYAPKSDPELEKVAETDDYDELFFQQEARELSDRLSNRPISNLTKALSINERILTCNELFKKDNNRFNEALIKLNSFGSFAEARPYLAELAKTFEWNNKEKKKRAQIFIKLVRRRYN